MISDVAILYHNKCAMFVGPEADIRGAQETTAAGRTIEPIREALPARHPPHRGAMDVLFAIENQEANDASE